MASIRDGRQWVQTIEGIVEEKYPYEDAPESVQVRGAYQTGLFDGLMYATFFFSLVGLWSVGFVLWYAS
jgi:hypothetical protein